jgi:hypothetical protein
MATNTVALLSPSPKVVDYANKIQASWKNAVESILSVASLLKEAENSLTDAEWFDLIGQLPFTQSAAVKLLAIGEDTRINNPKNVNLFPPHWTTLYEISTLPNDVFKEGVKEGLISSKVKRRDIVELKNQIATSRSTTNIATIATTNASVASSSRLASVSIPTNYDLNELPKLRKALQRIAETYGVSVEFDKSKSGILARERDELANKTEEWLFERSKTYNIGVSQEDVEILEDAFFQFRNRKEYHPDPETGQFVKQDIRNPNHRYHGKESKDMYDLCLSKKIITRFTPVRKFDQEAHVQTLLLQHSRGNAKHRADAKMKLERLIKRGGDISRKSAQEALNLLVEFGS